MAVNAIFNSWENDRAILYRKINGIDDAMGTAVVIQEMVFGNLNEISGTGVASLETLLMVTKKYLVNIC